MGLTVERLHTMLYYDSARGKFLWRVPPANARVGDVAGSLDIDGYVMVPIDDKVYRADLLAWFYLKSEWPGYEIEPKNGDRADYRWLNLRPKSRATPPRPARKATAVKSSLPDGVRYDRRLKRYWAIDNNDTPVSSHADVKSAEIAANVARRTTIIASFEYNWLAS